MPNERGLENNQFDILSPLERDIYDVIQVHRTNNDGNTPSNKTILQILCENYGYGKSDEKLSRNKIGKHRQHIADMLGKPRGF